MAAGAVCAELAIVFIIGFVAGDAVGWGSAKFSAGMAARTVGKGMRAGQGKTCLTVRKRDLGPALSHVAAGAVCAHLAVMFVIWFVAGNTIL